MNREKFDSFISKIYQKYWDSIPTTGNRTYYNEFGFIEKIKEDVEFSKEIDLKIEEYDLTYGQRYRYWFFNNFETGMEYTPEIKPNFDNNYYEPTPTKLIKVTHNKTTFEYYV